MDQNRNRDLQQMLANKDLLRQIAQSPEAKALAAMLSSGQDSGQLQNVAAQAASGNTQQLAALVKEITSTPQGSELLRKLGTSLNKQ